MKSAALTLLVALFLASPSPCSGDSALVRQVYDGDTILLADGRKVRYLGIDAPEIDHEGGRSEVLAWEALRFNRRLVKGNSVRLEFDGEKKDRYGRLLAYVFLPDGGMVNALLLKHGLAHVLFFPSISNRYREFFLRCQQEAMESGKGLWGKSVKRIAPYYLGNRRTLRFHTPQCPFGRKTAPRNRIRFKTWREAFAAGYSPCRRCRPWALMERSAPSTSGR